MEPSNDIRELPLERAVGVPVGAKPLMVLPRPKMKECPLSTPSKHEFTEADKKSFQEWLNELGRRILWLQRKLKFLKR